MFAPTRNDKEIVLIVTFILVGVIINACSNQESRKFHPKQDSLFNIEFEYPYDWGEIIEDFRYERRLLIYDPRTYNPECEGELHCYIGQSIDISVFIIEEHINWVDIQIWQSRDIYTRDARLEIIEEEAIKIDSEDGWAFTVYNNEYHSFTRNIIVQNENRGYFISISLLSIEEMDGEFYADYIKLITNLKFIEVTK